MTKGRPVTVPKAKPKPLEPVAIFNGAPVVGDKELKSGGGYIPLVFVFDDGSQEAHQVVAPLAMNNLYCSMGIAQRMHPHAKCVRIKTVPVVADVFRITVMIQMRTEDLRPCIGHEDYRDTGGDAVAASFRFCDQCSKDSGHSQHEKYANRCKWCAVLLSVGTALKCYGTEGVLHQLFNKT